MILVGAGCDAGVATVDARADAPDGGVDATTSDAPSDATRGDTFGMDTRAADTSMLDASPPDSTPPDARVTETRTSDTNIVDVTTTPDGTSAFALPPVNGSLDYQLGGAYPPPAGVTIVSRDRTASPAPGIYNVCYVNGFQVQPGEESWWMTSHPDLILRDSAGMPVIDRDWDEVLIDVSTPEKRAAVAGIIGGYIDECAADGFDAIEIDNLDSYSRSIGLLDENDAVAVMRLFSDRAHAAGLAIAQKNSTELVGRRAEMGTDFAVAEECNRYDECDDYIGGYGEHVLIVEYRRGDFAAGCSAYPYYSIVLRDLDLVSPSDSGYVYDGC